jgi:hypothetical protein
MASRHHTEAKEAGSTGPRGISRTTGVTKSCTGAGYVAGWVPGLLWEVVVGMNVASSQTTALTSGSHPEHHESGRAVPGYGSVARCERTLGANRGENCERKSGQLRATQIAWEHRIRLRRTRYCRLWSRRPRVRVPSLTSQKIAPRPAVNPNPICIAFVGRRARRVISSRRTSTTSTVPSMYRGTVAASGQSESEALRLRHAPS